MRKVGLVAKADMRAAAELRIQTPLAELRTAPAATAGELHTPDSLRTFAESQACAVEARPVLAAELRGCPRLAELYEVGRELGRGHFGVVRLCEDRATGERFACKTILLSGVRRRSDLMELRAEVLSLLRLQEGQGEQGAGERGRGEGGAGSADGEQEELAFVRLYEVVVETRTALHLILEYCPGGDLFGLVMRQKRLTEAQAAAVFRQLLLAVHTMHRTGIVHRDLKPENILSSPSPTLLVSPPIRSLPSPSPVPPLSPTSPFHLPQSSLPLSPSLISHPSSPLLSRPPSPLPTASPPPRAPTLPPLPPLCSSSPPTHATTATNPPPCACTGVRVKIADFGLAAALARGQTAACGVVGSPLYMAPEIIRGRPYAGEVDMWSLGCVLYTCLSGTVPFHGRTHREVFASVLGSAPDLKGEVWQGISREAKQLLRCLLVTDPGRRLKAHEVLKHPWVRAACGGECGSHEREWGKEKKRDNGQRVMGEGGCKTDCSSGMGDCRNEKSLAAECKVSGGVVHVEKACVGNHSEEGADGQHVVGCEECCPGRQARSPRTCCHSSRACAAGRLAQQKKAGGGASRRHDTAETGHVHGLARGGRSGRSVSTASCDACLPFIREPSEQSTQHSGAAVGGDAEEKGARWTATVQDCAAPSCTQAGDLGLGGGAQGAGCSL
ncbi:unnamed protein product [Closterium sp. Yama58-4]|nr:unnamed protein product [Closterium sp. Yama58-4]